MSKTFKVVCIGTGHHVYLTVGKVYDGKTCGSAWCIKNDNGSVHEYHDNSLFLRLPTEPKTCADMTMEEYLAMVCLIGAGDKVQYDEHGTGFCCNATLNRMPAKVNTRALWRVKPEKSAKDIEIERIEKEMRKLADDLAKIKEK